MTAAEARQLPYILTPVVHAEWPTSPPNMFALWHSRLYIVQCLSEPGGMVRLNVQQVDVDDDGRPSKPLIAGDFLDIAKEVGYSGCKIYVTPLEPTACMVLA